MAQWILRQSTKRQSATRYSIRVLAATALAAAGALSFAPSGNAQNPSVRDQAPAPALPKQSANIPDQKLDAAAAAMKQVANIRQDYQQKLDSAAPSDQEQISTEANTALQKAVTDQGLSVDEYNAIIQVAQNDPDVRQKILQRIRGSGEQ